MKVWLVNEGENLPGDDNNPRLQRMGLLAYELGKLGQDVVWWQSTFNHYQKKFRYSEDKDIPLTDNMEMKLLHACGYQKNVCLKRLYHEWKTAYKFYVRANKELLPDVIVSAMPTIAQAHYTVKFAKKHRIPVIVDIRDLNPDVFGMPFRGGVKKVVELGIVPLKIVLGSALRNATALVGTTDPYLQWGLNYASRTKKQNDRVFFVSYPDNGVTESLSEGSRWSRFENTSSLVCCFFGQFGQLVDFETVMDAAQKCKENQMDVQFLLCGKGELLEHYQQVVESRGLTNVHLPGWVNKTDISDIGFVSDVGLMAYKKNDNFEMQMPNKFSEYLSLGLAIMLQPTGIMKDVIESNNCGIQYNTSDELYEALKRLCENRDMLKEMKRNSRALFERSFAAEQVYQEYGRHVMEIAKEYQHEV